MNTPAVSGFAASANNVVGLSHDNNPTINSPTVVPLCGVRETIAWLLRLGRPPLPENPIEAAKQGKEPKQPCFLDNKGYFKSVNWKHWQNTQPNLEIIDAWFCQPKTGIGTLGGWNGKHWLGWTDFDQKDFSSAIDCDRSISQWMEQYPIVKIAPMFRTPSGGYRFLFAFDGEPQNFKANSGFSLKLDGSHHCGELLCKNGGHTLLPPTLGLNGEAYRWVQWSEYPPVVGSPEEIGLYPVVKKTSIKPIASPKSLAGNGTLNTNSNCTLSDFLENEIYPRLDLQQAFNWTGHDFQQHGDKLKGNCPWHDSQSGTAFYCERKSNALLWRCPACDLGGSVIEYRHRIKGGNGSPKGREFVELVQELADEVGVALPEREKESKRTQQSGTHNVIPIRPTLDIELDTIKSRYLTLLELGASLAEIETFKIKSRQDFPLLQPSELSKLLDAVAEEFYKQQEESDEADEIRKLVEAAEETINLADYLPAKLAKPLAQYCQWQNLRHAVVLTSLLTAVSSLHKVSTELVIHRNLNFKVPPTLFGAIVAESGAKKSPIFRATAREPLNILKDFDREVYQSNQQSYQAELEEWEVKKAELQKGQRMTDPKPSEPPLPPIYYFSEATGEGIKAQAARCPDKSLFALIDELSGFFHSSNQYRGGKGSDRQDLLSYFDGTGATVLRSGGVKVDVSRIYLSILGTIQPEVLKKAIGNTHDLDGSWSRWLFAVQPNVPSVLADEGAMGVDTTELISYFFGAIHNLPVIKYRLSRAAFELYQKFYNRLEQLRVSHPSSGMRAVYSKAEGITGRLALNLHALHELSSDRAPSEEIPEERMREAINLMKFFIGQVRMIHASVDEALTAPQIVKVIELSLRKQSAGESGWIKAREIQQNCTKKERPSTKEIRDWMIQAAASGYGENQGEGVKVEFRAFPKNVGDCRQNVGDCRRTVGESLGAETIDISGKQENVVVCQPAWSTSKIINLSLRELT